jgi:hypothetical protein
MGDMSGLIRAEGSGTKEWNDNLQEENICPALQPFPLKSCVSLKIFGLCSLCIGVCSLSAVMPTFTVLNFLRHLQIRVVKC